VEARRLWSLVGGVAVVACAMAVAAYVAVGPIGEAASHSQIAVVLVPDIDGSELVSVDVGSGRVTGRLRLRSLATDIEADAEHSVVVAAQTGGVAGTADDALSVFDPRTGRVDYITLPTIDPSQVECVAGRAMVLHAVIRDDGFVVSGADPGSREATEAGRIPDGTGLWAAARGSLWTAVTTTGPVPFSLLRIDPGTLSTVPGPVLDFVPYGITEAGERTLVLGDAGVAGGSPARVALLDEAATAVVASSGVPGLAHGARISATVGDLIVIGDWDGEAPETSSLQVVQRSTLRHVGSIEVGGAPCALASTGEKLLVVDRVTGTLLRIDPRNGRVEWRTSLGATDLVCSKVVVLPGTPR